MFDTFFSIAAVNAAVDELRRLNDNIERYLRYKNVPLQADADASGDVYVGQPLSEAELAVKEYAEERGLEWRAPDDTLSEV